MKALADAGAIPVVGSITETPELISTLAFQSRIVINAADCRDPVLTQAILKGLWRRKDETGKNGTLIHTSGIGNFVDGKTDGKLDPQGKFYDVRSNCAYFKIVRKLTDIIGLKDSNEEDIKMLTPHHPYGQVDIPYVFFIGALSVRTNFAY